MNPGKSISCGRSGALKDMELLLLEKERILLLGHHGHGNMAAKGSGTEGCGAAAGE